MELKLTGASWADIQAQCVEISMDAPVSMPPKTPAAPTPHKGQEGWVPPAGPNPADVFGGPSPLSPSKGAEAAHQEAPPEPEVFKNVPQTTTTTPAETELPPPVTPPELDVNGIPWDPRIHASTKTKMKNGAWKVKRGTPVELLNSVMAEITPTATGVSASAYPPDPAGAPAETATPPTGDGIPSTLTEFTEYSTAINGSGKGTYVQIQKLLAENGIPDIRKIPAEEVRRAATILFDAFGVPYATR